MTLNGPAEADDHRVCGDHDPGVSGPVSQSCHRAEFGLIAIVDRHDVGACPQLAAGDKSAEVVCIAKG